MLTRVFLSCNAPEVCCLELVYGTSTTLLWAKPHCLSGVAGDTNYILVIRSKLEDIRSTKAIHRMPGGFHR